MIIRAEEELVDVLSRWEPVIGLEVHAQLKTRSKLFSADPAEYGGEPNTRISPYTLGYPGTLPVLNREAVTMALAFGFAVGANLNPVTRFDRKNYFYPDLPKGYQITQYDTPLFTRGFIPIGYRSELLIRLERIHLEEDAGKSMHTEEGTRVDYNRAGVPLIEIVTAPDMRTPAEAYACLVQVRRMLTYLEICDGNMEEGSLRCDANISVRRRGTRALGAKVELKNLNSFHGVERALTYEIRRQAGVLGTDGEVRSETRLWDETLRETRTMRTKEESHDYRYFPEPDLPPLVIDESWSASVAADLPDLAHNRGKRYVYEYGLTEEEADRLVDEKAVADYFESVIKAADNRFAPRDAALWVMDEVVRARNEAKGKEAGFGVAPSRLATLIALVKQGAVSTTGAREVFQAMGEQDDPPETLVRTMRLEQVGGEDELRDLARTVIESNPDEAGAYRAGKTALLDFFMGKAMNASGGRAHPERLRHFLRSLLDGE